jgi:hypothetical protein
LSCYINDIYLSHRACARNKRISHYMYQLTTCALIIHYNKLTHKIN